MIYNYDNEVTALREDARILSGGWNTPPETWMPRTLGACVHKYVAAGWGRHCVGELLGVTLPEEGPFKTLPAGPSIALINRLLPREFDGFEVRYGNTPTELGQFLMAEAMKRVMLIPPGAQAG